MADMLNRLASLSPEKRALVLRRLSATGHITSAHPAKRDPVVGDVPLLPLPRQFLTMAAAFGLNYHHFNVAALHTVEQPLDPLLIEQVVRHLMEHHDALRLRIEQGENGWRQYIISPDAMGEVPFSVLDLSLLPEAEQTAMIEATTAQLQTSLHLSRGPIVRVAYFNLGSQRPGRLFFLVHHMATDEFSMRILSEDFVTAYQQLSRGEPMRLPPKTTSVKEHHERLVAYAQSATLREERGYWQGLPWSEIQPVPVDSADGVAARAIPRIVEVQLSVEETSAVLQSIPGPGGARLRDLLLTALMQVFTRWSGSQTHLFTLLGSGRKPIFEDMDLSRTVGWLSVIPNAVLHVPATDSTEELVQSVTEQLRCMPYEGVGYALLSNYSGDAEIAAEFGAYPRPTVAFNYLGKRFTSNVLTSASESVGRVSQVPNLWNSRIQVVSAEMVAHQLHIRWEYSETVYFQATIEGFIQHFREALQSLCTR